MDVSRRSLLRGAGVTAALGTAGQLSYRTLGANGEPKRATALVAGSLLRLAEQFRDAVIEAHGSAAVRRLLLNGLRDPDAVALADPRLFDGISERATLFATNALVLTYDSASDYARDLKQDWRTTIERENLHLGRTDPEKDPLGYRTVMALRLAEREYGVNARHVLKNSNEFPETGLLNAVEGGKLDAAFTYRNMAVQRDLPYISLPDAIDFSNPEYSVSYRRASYDLGDDTIRGAPIRYAAAATTAAGEPWVERLVTAEEVLRETGFTVPADYPDRNVRIAPLTE